MELRTFASIAEDILARPPRRGGTRLVAVDGGSAAGKSTFGRRELSDHLDHVIWVDADRQLAFDRGMARPGEDPDFWREWELEEEAHFEADRPWERADLLVSHDPPAPLDPEVAVRVITAATWSRAARPG